ncbi:DUF1206 domain-containing protein [Pacificimonas sp. WHA3]|uniref:DUF1206 domain-containing protein n=1 Tax=Pacificimonas pallii TaxID=2827236 RepID=A0ABS6SC90_9SPHN|nr:DUF1206 domain-containing protein [Pacificimonas pallii]MBV7256032.1 DUF1206 domain-containing protein [Pacificimonas pallii]
MNRVTRLETFARIGFLARGIVYILIGYFALTSANAQGTTGILDQMKDVPLGNVILVLIGIGLLGYGVFRLFGAMANLEGESGAKGAAIRTGHAASGFAHLFLGYYAISGVFGSGGAGGSGSGGGSGEAASMVSSLPGGTALLVIIGIGLALAGLNQLKKAVTAKFMSRLDADAPPRVKIIGQAGYAARFVVFVVLGWQVITAATSSNAAQIGGFGDVLSSLRDTQWLYIAVALGFIMFGVFSLVMARYRRIRNEDVIERLKAEAAA